MNSNEKEIGMGKAYEYIDSDKEETERIKRELLVEGYTTYPIGCPTCGGGDMFDIDCEDCHGVGVVLVAIEAEAKESDDE